MSVDILSIQTSFYAQTSLAGKELSMADGAKLRLPFEDGAPPLASAGDLPADPLRGPPCWSAFDDEGEWVVQGFILTGVKAPPELGRALGEALRAFGVGVSGIPASREAIETAWLRAIVGAIPPLPYQLLADAGQALRSGYSERAVLEAGIAVEVAITLRYREAAIAAGATDQDVRRALKNNLGLYKRAQLLAPLLGTAAPDAQLKPASNGGFPRLLVVKSARNDVAHTGKLGAQSDPTDLVGACRALVDLVAVDPWAAPAG